MPETQSPEVPIKQSEPATKPKSSLLRRIGYVAQNVALATTSGGAALLARGVGAEEIDNMREPGESKGTKLVEKQISVESRKLSDPEISAEGDRLITEFVGLFKDDPDVQRGMSDALLNYEKEERSGVLFFNKGNVQYVVDTVSSRSIGEPREDRFFLRRVEEGKEEKITIRRGASNSRKTPSGIFYLAHDVDAKYIPGKEDIEGATRSSNDKATVKSVGELLAKTQKDFGKEIK